MLVNNRNKTFFIQRWLRCSLQASMSINLCSVILQAQNVSSLYALLLTRSWFPYLTIQSPLLHRPSIHGVTNCTMGHDFKKPSFMDHFLHAPKHSHTTFWERQENVGMEGMPYIWNISYNDLQFAPHAAPGAFLDAIFYCSIKPYCTR